MKDNVLLTTENGRGWKVLRGKEPNGIPLTPGGGISIIDGTISLAEIDGVQGTFRNPTVVIDSYGRVVLIEEGVTPEILPTETVPNFSDVEQYEGPATTLLALDDGNGRAGIFIKEGEAFVGPAYITGARGQAGEKGDTGDSGLDGVDGKDGEKGEDGQQGPLGPQGVQGVQGPAGSKGDAGPQGPEGPQGIQGVAGEAGPQGLQGSQGPEGPMGSFLTPDEYGNIDEDAIARIQTAGSLHFFLVNPEGDLRANRAVPSGISGDMQLHLIGYSQSSGWTDYGQLTGAQGPRGFDGAQGPQGPSGSAGIQGLQGPRGEKGDKGDQGDAGPQGLQGPQGETGPKGDDGPEGPVGPAGPSGASSASRVLLREVTSTVAGPEQIVTGINASQYDHIYITFTGFFSSDATASMTLRLGNNSYLSSGYYSTIDSDANTNATSHVILGGGGSTSLDRSSGEVCLRLNREICVGHSRRSSGSTPAVRRIVSILPSIANFNQLRFSASSGNMGAGVTIKVYGVR